MPVRLSLAINDSDHVRDVVTGRVPVEGVSLVPLHYAVEEIFYRFTRHREWDVSELSLAKYCALRAAGDESLVAVPVFPSRAFRHSGIYVRPDGPVDRPQDLRGARIGFPEWTVTATVWIRSLLEDEYGVEATSVRWVQGGVNQAGRIETLEVPLPEGIAVTREHERTLSELLVAGELDAVIAPRAPAPFLDGSGRVVRLFSDPATHEREYWERTGIFPIMHLLAMRAEVYQRDPWIAANLVKAFETAKAQSVRRALDDNAPRWPVPWAPAHAAQVVTTFGGDPWPYGLEPNRVTLEAFLAAAAAQSVCARRLAPEELFVPETLTSFRI